MAELRFSDASIYYETHAAVNQTTQLPLVLVAGLASDSQSWQPVLEPLRQARQVILIDNRGSGRTRAPAGTCLKQMAQDCLAVCDHLGLDQFDLLGHSMGGFIALNVAQAAPQRIDHLIICNSSATQSARNQMMFTDWADSLQEHGPTARWYRTFFYWILTRGFFDDPQRVTQLLKLAMSYPYAPDAMAFKSQVLAMQGFDATSWLAQITTKTLVLSASEDLLFPPGTDGSGLAKLPNAEIQILSGLAHSLPMEAPKVFCDRVLAFLNR